MITPLRCLKIVGLLLLSALSAGQKPRPPWSCPTPLVLDGHTHMGFEAGPTGEIRAVGLDPSQNGGFAALAFAMPIQREAVTDLMGRLADEVEQLRNMGRREGVFRLSSIPEDAVSACEAGMAPVFLTLEHFGGVFENEPERVARFRALGIRSITLVNSETDHLLDREEHDAKLTPLGSRVVEAMNREGVVVDISHLRTEEMMAVISASTAPVLASHSNPNISGGPESPLSDLVIRAMAEKGGLIMLSFNANDLFTAEEDQSLAVKRYLDQMEHIRELVGAEHLGIGTDLQAGGRYVPEAMRSPEVIRAIQAGMDARGYTPEEVAGVLGGNFIRLLGNERAFRYRHFSYRLNASMRNATPDQGSHPCLPKPNG